MLVNFKPLIEREIDGLVHRFQDAQARLPEFSLVIGDADTMRRLRSAQHKYILDMFNGYFDIEYVNNRMRIGLAHKHVGVDSKFYLAAIQTMKTMLADVIRKSSAAVSEQNRVISALEKVLMFDVSLVFDTYVRSLLTEIETAKMKAEEQALVLEEKVAARTARLKSLSRTDPLTGLQNMRHLEEVLTQSLRAAQRRGEVLTVVYFDIDDFKAINDTYGHQHGDAILKILGKAIRKVSRAGDHCFRYGGDEFCVVMTNCSEAQARQVYSQRLLQEVRKYGQDISFSIGYAQTGPHEYASSRALIHKADVEMYAEKLAAKKRKHTHRLSLMRLPMAQLAH
jgi:diguanylate cyclase